MLFPNGMRFSERWRTPTVQALATAAYESRAGNGNLDDGLLGVLADACEDAGCEEPHILGNLRQARERRWSWALGVILWPYSPADDLEPYLDAIRNPSLTPIEFVISRRDALSTLADFVDESRHRGWGVEAREDQVNRVVNIRLDRPWRWPWFLGGARDGEMSGAMTLPLRDRYIAYEPHDRFDWSSDAPFETCEYRLHYYTRDHFIGETRLPVYVAAGTPLPARCPFEMPTRRPAGPQ